MGAPVCECCGEINLWAFFFHKHSYCCKECAATNDVGEDEDGYFRIRAYCMGGCGLVGLVNYSTGGGIPLFYCGGFTSCTP